MRRKLYCYVDESGQDTKGVFFVVAVVVTDERRNELEAALERIERSTGKRKVKWQRAERTRRISYLEEVSRLSDLASSLFYRITRDQKNYLEATATATASAATSFLKDSEDSAYELKVIVDGLKQAERPRLRQILSRLGLQRVSTIGARDESNAFIRLADAIAGLVRSAEDGDKISADLLKRLQRGRIILEV